MAFPAVVAAASAVAVAAGPSRSRVSIGLPGSAGRGRGRVSEDPRRDGRGRHALCPEPCGPGKRTRVRAAQRRLLIVGAVDQARPDRVNDPAGAEPERGRAHGAASGAGRDSLAGGDELCRPSGLEYGAADPASGERVLVSEISLRTMGNGMRAPLATGSDAASMRARAFAGTRPDGHEITAQEIFLKKFFANAKEFVIVIPAHIRLGSSVGRAGD